MILFWLTVDNKQFLVFHSVGQRPPMLRVRMFLLVGLVRSLMRTQGCRNNNEDIYSTRTQWFHTRLLNKLTLGLQLYTWSPSLLYKHTATALISTYTVTSLLHFNKQTRPPSILTKSPSFTRDLRHSSVNTTESRDYSLNTPGKPSFRMYFTYIFKSNRKKLKPLFTYNKGGGTWT